MSQGFDCAQKLWNHRLSRFFEKFFIPYSQYFLFLAIVVYLFQELVFQGKAFVGGNDRLVITVPLHQLLAETLMDRHLPIWNSFNLSGCRGMGAWVLGNFYPLNPTLALLFPTHIMLAESWCQFVEVFLMFVVGYFLFLKVWQDRILAVFSCVVYSLSVSTVMNFNNLLHPPLFLLLMLHVLWDWRRRSMRSNVLYLAIAVFLQLSGGFPQSTAYYLLFAFAVSLARTAVRPDVDARVLLRFFALWSAAMALALMLNALDIVSFLDAYRSSNRTALAYGTIVANLQQPWFMAFRLIFPYFLGDYYQFPLVDGNRNINDSEAFATYAGIVTLIFCLIALSRLRRRDVWPWFAGIFFLILCSIRTPFAVIPYLLFLKAPLLHGRIVCLIPPAMAFLAPVGMKVYLEGSKRFQNICIASVVAVSAAVFVFLGSFGGLGAGLFSFVDAARISMPLDSLLLLLRDSAAIFAIAAVATTIILTAFRMAWMGARAFKLACLALLLVDLGFFARAHALTKCFADESDWYPRNPVARFLQQLPDKDQYRFHILLGLPWPGLPPFSPVQPNWYQPSINIHYGLRDINGYENFLDDRYTAFVTQGAPRPVPMRMLLPGTLVSDPRMADMLAVKYYVVPDQPASSGPLSGFTDPLFSSGGVAVLQKQRALGRFRLVCRTAVASTLPETLSVLHASGFDPESTAIVEPDSGLHYDGSLCGEGRDQRLQMEEIGSGLLRGTAELRRPALLVVTETFNPGWRAWINGRPAKVHRINYAFQGIELLPGVSSIEMRFHPWYIDPALYAAFIAMMILVAMAFYPFCSRLRGLNHDQ